MKNLISIGLLVLTNLSFAQSISTESPMDYSSEPFGVFAVGMEKTKILKTIDRFMIGVNTRDKIVFDDFFLKA